jgi:HEAT repeat protein
LDLEQIHAALRSRKTEDRIRAGERLSASRNEHVPLLLEMLADRSHYVAGIAARKIAEHSPEGVERDLLRIYHEREAGGAATDPGCAVRMGLAIALGKLRYHPAVETIRRGLRARQLEGGVDTAAALRGNCALALAHLAPLDAARDIAILLYDGRSGPLDNTLAARKAAAQALGMLGDPAAQVVLALRLAYPSDEDPDVLAECMDALVSLEDPRVLESLEPLLHHRDPQLVARAALAIGRTGHEDAARLLLETCERLKGDLLRAVALALSAMRTDESQAALRELASSVREEGRLAAVEALSAAPDAACRTLLSQMAESDSSPRVRHAAQSAVDSAGG